MHGLNSVFDLFQKTDLLDWLKLEFIVWEVFLIFFLPKETLGRKKPYVRGYHGVTGLWRQILKFHKVSFSFEIPFYGKILVQKIFSSSSLIFSKNRRVCDVIDPESDIVESRKNAFFGLLG